MALCAVSGKPNSAPQPHEFMMGPHVSRATHGALTAPPPYRRKLGRLTEHCRLHDSPVVPDPYAGGAQGFEEVLDLVEDACDGLVTMLRRQHGAA